MSTFQYIKKDYSIKVSSRIVNSLNPDCICVPYDSNDKLLVKEKDYIYKNQLLLESINNKKFCSISGVCLGIKKIDDKEYLVIKNDYKEKKVRKFGNKIDISKLNKEKSVELINKYGTKNTIELINRLLVDDSIDHLIINGCDTEPYIVSNVFLINKNIDDILETIDSLREIFNIRHTHFIIKNIDKDMVSNVIDNIGTYPNIKLKIIGDIYPFNNVNLISKTVVNKTDNYLVLDLNDIYEIGYILKKSSPVTEKYITITGNGIVNPVVMNIKLYSPIKPFIDDSVKLKNIDDYCFIENGLMNGKKIDIEQYIVNKNTNGLLYNTIEEYTSTNCIKCGCCINSCPMKLNPIKDKNSEKCIGCNICEYVCPSHINLINNKEGGDLNE